MLNFGPINFDNLALTGNVIPKITVAVSQTLSASKLTDDGTTLSYDGVPIAGGGGQKFKDEVVPFVGAAGMLSHSPSALIGIFRNGLRMRSMGASPEFIIVGAAVTLTLAAGGTDVFDAVYFY